MFKTYVKIGGCGPNVSVVPANDRVRHHFGVQQLVIDVALPAHGYCAVEKCVRKRVAIFSVVDSDSRKKKTKSFS